MAQRYDVSLKSLFQREGDGLIRRILFGSRITGLLPTEQPRISNHRADIVARTEDGALHHVEFQAHNEPAFHLRMLEYYIYLARTHHQHVEQVVLYIGQEPRRLENHFKSPSVEYSFRVVDLCELDAAPLLASDDWADNALALLAKGEPTRAFEALLPRLRAMQPEDQQWAAATLVLLSGIMGAEQFVEDRLKEFGMINVMENKVLGPIMRQQFEQGLEVGMERGIERGMERGIEQGMERGIERGMEQGRSLAQQLLQQLITEKFGHPPAWAINRIHSASLQDLQHWTSRILRATTLDDTLRADGSE